MKSQLLLNSGLSNFNNIKIQYIKNPITNNNSHFHNSSLNSEDIDKKSYFTILLVSRIVRIKNIILAIEAIRILKSMGFNYSLNIVGAIVDKVYFSELNNFIISHDLSNNIIFFGSRQDVNDLIVNSDICLLTSISEGFPNVILEYMQQNKPIISTKCFFNYENYKQIFFTENSGDEIASKILSLKNMKINSNYYKNILAEHSINSFIYNINKNLNIEDSNNRF
jgi:glycosyltransferase involved in cell wall biosynthesis